MDLLITCLPGLSGLLCQELAGVGLEAEPAGHAAVRLAGADSKAALTVCLHARLAERVLVEIDHCPVTPEQAAETLAGRFDPARHLASTSRVWLQVDHAREVRGDARITGTIFHKHLPEHVERADSARDALCLRLHVAPEEAWLYVDLVGEPLSRRGYRVQPGQAPLRESLAAAMVLTALGDKDAVPLVDLFCGSGTLLVEAACILTRRAPGLLREQWAFRQWPGIRNGLWDGLCEAARSEQRALPEGISLRGYDADPRAVTWARANAERAGVQALLHVERRELGTLKPADIPASAVLLANPPWGERLEDKPMASALHMGMARMLPALAPGCPLVILGSDIEVMDRLGVEPQQQLRLQNGPVRNFIRVLTPQSKPAAPVLHASAPAFEVPELAAHFANRLQKNARQLRKWLQQEDVQAYRLYDRDMPEFNLVVDIYGDQVLVQEYAPPKTVDPSAARERRNAALAAVRAVMGVHREQVHVRTREQQKGQRQYQKLAPQRSLLPLREGDAWYLLDLNSYLDTGVFLDHRPARLRLSQEAAGRRMLNLFAYTGTASVQAAVGGARSTLTVDASNRYLQWAGENMAFNGYAGERHRRQRADVMDWLQRSSDQFDLIFCDPPTFSNNKSRDDFVVQRDHAELIQRAMKHLEPEGVLYFSCNFSRFTLDDSVHQLFDVEDLTESSISPDFQRGSRPHVLFAVRHTPRGRGRL
ncbi:MAG: bifunctional 23S rRNA (guanine(2069)-N(7))-methyltransferase RlmK/23S rRNA (guanine(2445)-N(2))-methyltransferase RlmL [Alcanivoracaceae bacterium]|nr:bifunctional 23S rRNA (guanine(2069)-N(7))-methyltransferase RlmK/23S rRNA (guanine(2445)-N(2))-methyltransferase RlmL [Alcanivoracaceae bacterium]